MATTSLNIVQRLGGPTFTTLCATFLEWRLAAAPSHTGGGAFTESFLLLCGLQALLVVAAARLPLSISRTAAAPTAEETMADAELMSE